MLEYITPKPINIFEIEVNDAIQVNTGSANKYPLLPVNNIFIVKKVFNYCHMYYEEWNTAHQFTVIRLISYYLQLYKSDDIWYISSKNQYDFTQIGIYHSNPRFSNLEIS